MCGEEILELPQVLLVVGLGAQLQGVRGGPQCAAAPGKAQDFPDVESIMVAWHERQITGHLHELAALRDGPGGPGERLAAVLEAYAFIQRRRHGHGVELSALLHRGEHVVHAERHLHGFVRDLLAEGAEAGEVRGDVAPDELATYCLHALAAAGGLSSEAAVRRLVAVTVAGLRPSN